VRTPHDCVHIVYKSCCLFLCMSVWSPLCRISIVMMYGVLELHGHLSCLRPLSILRARMHVMSADMSRWSCESCSHLVGYRHAVHPVGCCLQNFHASMTVTIGDQPCGNITIRDPVTLTAFQCVAPPGPGIGDVQLRVTVAGSGTGSFLFQYSPPVVQWVSGTPCDAEVSCPVQVWARAAVSSGAQGAELHHEGRCSLQQTVCGCALDCVIALRACASSRSWARTWA